MSPPEACADSAGTEQRARAAASMRRPRRQRASFDGADRKKSERKKKSFSGFWFSFVFSAERRRGLASRDVKKRGGKARRERGGKCSEKSFSFLEKSKQKSERSRATEPKGKKKDRKKRSWQLSHFKSASSARSQGRNPLCPSSAPQRTSSDPIPRFYPINRGIGPGKKEKLSRERGGSSKKKKTIRIKPISLVTTNPLLESAPEHFHLLPFQGRFAPRKRNTSKKGCPNRSRSAASAPRARRAAGTAAMRRRRASSMPAQLLVVGEEDFFVQSIPPSSSSRRSSSSRSCWPRPPGRR